MLKLILAASLALVVTTAAAERPSTLGMSCAEAADLVNAHGAIVLGTGVHTYKRFVAHRGYCLHFEQTEPAWAPTAEGRCIIGKICVNRHRLRRDR
jgi:hypothetical protein